MSDSCQFKKKKKHTRDYPTTVFQPSVLSQRATNATGSGNMWRPYLYQTNKLVYFFVFFFPLLAADESGGSPNYVLIITWGYIFFSFPPPVKQLQVSAASGSPSRSLTRGGTTRSHGQRSQSVHSAAVRSVINGLRDESGLLCMHACVCVRVLAGGMYFDIMKKLNCIHLAWHFSKVIAQQFSATQSGLIEFRPLFCLGPSVDYLQSMQITRATCHKLQCCSFTPRRCDADTSVIKITFWLQTGSGAESETENTVSVTFMLFL